MEDSIYYCDNCNLKITLDTLSVLYISCPACGSKSYRKETVIQQPQINNSVKE